MPTKNDARIALATKLTSVAADMTKKGAPTKTRAVGILKRMIRQHMADWLADAVETPPGARDPQEEALPWLMKLYGYIVHDEIAEAKKHYEKGSKRGSVYINGIRQWIPEEIAYYLGTQPKTISGPRGPRY